MREILERGLEDHEGAADPLQEARRQSLLVSGRASESEALALVERLADRQGWR